MIKTGQRYLRKNDRTGSIIILEITEDSNFNSAKAKIVQVIAEGNREFLGFKSWRIIGNPEVEITLLQEQYAPRI